MKSFGIKIAVFCLAFFLFDKVFILLREYSPSLEADTRLEEVINGEMNKEIIVLGSSKGARDILAAQIEEELGMSAYNLSYPGSGVEFHEFLLRKLLENNTHPKIVILTIDEEVQFVENSSIKFRLDRMYPLVSYPQIREELYKRGEKSELLSKLFVLHQLSIYNFDIRPKKNSKHDQLDPDGSMPVDFRKENIEWQYEANRKEYNTFVESDSKLNALRHIVQLCEENDIQLVFSFPPTYKAINLSFYERFKKLAGEVPIHVYANEQFKNELLFHDLTHLNREGAKEYTSGLCSFLKNELKVE